MDYLIEWILWAFLVENFKTNNLIQRHEISWDIFFTLTFLPLHSSTCVTVDIPLSFCFVFLFPYFNFVDQIISFFLLKIMFTKCLFFFPCSYMFIHYYQYVFFKELSFDFMKLLLYYISNQSHNSKKKNDIYIVKFFFKKKVFKIWSFFFEELNLKFLIV